VRAIFAQLTGFWRDALTATQRTAWDTYAGNVAMTDALGDTIFITGFNHYIRSNVPRLQAGLGRIDDGPTVFDLGSFTPVTASRLSGTDIINVAFDNTDGWAVEDFASLLVFASRSQSETINFFKGPYRFAGDVNGNATTPPTSPATPLSPFTLVEGNKTFMRFRVSRADGRLSSDQFLEFIAGA
jgi:hypothetical protein